ncbi:MAG: metal ABC transporter permease [Patescibacteria group bacterium]|jgi:zinc transport system permease protein
MLEIFQYDFMIRAFVAGLIIAVTAPMIGSFLVVKRYSLFADTLAHVSLMGVAIGLLINVYPFYVALFTAVVAAIFIEFLRKSNRYYNESLLALFLSGSLAIATVLVSLAKGFNANLFSYLFGSITTITNTDVYVSAALGIITIICIALFYRQFFLISYDEDYAQASGIKTGIINVILVVLAAITIALAMRIVGALLIGALMVIPVITATSLAKSFKQVMGYAVILSLVAVTLGLFLSYYANLASGGTIVVVALALFISSSLAHYSK